MSRIEVPLPLLFAGMALIVVLMVQGTRLAADRQSEREPGRVTQLQPGEMLDLAAGAREFLYSDPGPGRLAVYQELPERRLLRWVEDDEPGRGQPLLIPLQGLGPGEYLITTAPDRTSAADQEMDRPATPAPVRARFRILPR